MGLGLTICHSVVKKHAGAITVETAPSSGTTFHVFLPASQQRVERVETMRFDRAQRQGRILVMDDELSIRNTFGRMLTQIGYEAELAPDGAVAVELYERAKKEDRRFDAVILDLTVRGAMGGLEALRTLLEIDPGVRAVVMSGHSDDEVMQDYSRYGFKGALGKPFDRSSLLDVLASLSSS
jgi:CheY-like chemotaxis protein